jgi:hypothetical protein
VHALERVFSAWLGFVWAVIFGGFAGWLGSGVAVAVAVAVPAFELGGEVVPAESDFDAAVLVSVVGSVGVSAVPATHSGDSPALVSHGGVKEVRGVSRHTGHTSKQLACFLFLVRHDFCP